ncbi:ankyrin repeat domain-containing protein [Leptospira sp. FAT2]|uniref:ankyrin repeat domain-containing protein n=1 Tax=Leptospira sanjuanensis TaxID=2879643 RepID=UPI001EE78C45|nr:ankyrin repeat domain-containing protein [Leptospira sanjuanensis]MCG6193143.1 ankyrin repeat domain-containing protein [Leptospira sanjuanensis]
MKSSVQNQSAESRGSHFSPEALSEFSEAWLAYRSSRKAPPPCFDFARNGNVVGLARNLRFESHIDEADSKGYTLLMLAAYNGREEATRFLISKGADVNATDAAGNSILMGAAFKGHIEIVRVLLEAGADKNYRNPKGQTALQFANLFGRTEVAELLSEVSTNGRLVRFGTFLKSWIIYLFQTIQGVKQ